MNKNLEKEEKIRGGGRSPHHQDNRKQREILEGAKEIMLSKAFRDESITTSKSIEKKDGDKIEENFFEKIPIKITKIISSTTRKN